jgi:hypothetical protein
VSDDRITCAACARFNGGDYAVKYFGHTYTFRGRCMAARPPLARIAELPHRCVYFNAVPGAADQRKGIERWPEFVNAPGGPKRVPHPPKDER